jgi:hypothetical protein
MASDSAKVRKVRRVPTSGMSRSALAKTPTRLPSVEAPRDAAGLLDRADAEADRVRRDGAEQQHGRRDEDQDGEQRADEGARLDAVERLDGHAQERLGDERHGGEQRGGSEHELRQAGERRVAVGEAPADPVAGRCGRT